MGLSNNPISFISLTLIFALTFVGFLPSTQTAQDYTTLVYKGCANQTFTDPSYSQTLIDLFNSLITQSSKNKFSKTTSGSGQTSISGLYQCRGDLSNSDCYKCVNKIPEMSKRLCGNTIAGRIQLNGCYGLYEVAGFPQVSGVKMLYKSCGGSQAAGSGFDDRRNTAFGQVENIVGNGGFYATSYQNMYVMGQCEGDLSSGDCVGCVKSAVQDAQVQCGGSISGQIYLHKCYISYSFYPNGVPTKSSSSSSSPFSSGPQHQNIGKTVAIVIGGTAAAGFVVMLLLFLKSLAKKRDDY